MSPSLPEEGSAELVAAAERRRSAYERIRLWGDPVLRSKARTVSVFDAALQGEVDEMIKVMLDAPGRGLAAPQVGSLRRIVVYQLGSTPGDGPTRVMINPKIVRSSLESEVFLEGCLSMPFVLAAVERASSVVVRAQDVSGRYFEVKGEGLHASVLQHELYHLDGILIPDRLSRPERRRFLRAVREAAAAGWPDREVLVGEAAELFAVAPADGRADDGGA